MNDKTHCNNYPNKCFRTFLCNFILWKFHHHIHAARFWYVIDIYIFIYIWNFGNVHGCVSKCLQNTSLSHKIVRRIINRVSNLWCEKLCFLYYNYYVVLNGSVREINCRAITIWKLSSQRKFIDVTIELDNILYVT